MKDDEIQQLIGFTRKPIWAPTKSRRYKRIEPEGDIIMTYLKELDYHEKFYTKNVDKTKQPWNSLKCSFEGCSFSTKAVLPMRRHYMAHYDLDVHDRCNCTKSHNHFATHKSLLTHASKGQCFISNGYPELKVFMKNFLVGLGDEQQNAKVCFKCKKEYKDAYSLRKHLLSCYRFSFPCYNYDAKFSTYHTARCHYENCDGTNSANPLRKPNTISYKSDKVTPPVEELK